MDIKDLQKKLGDFVITQLALELSRQGHNLTGALIESFETKVTENADTITIDFLILKYGASLQYGIKPEKIPYTPPPPYRGGTSKYIEGLIRFAMLKFHADKRTAKNIAFAIAAKHKKFGYPLSGKINFIGISLEANMDNIVKIIQDYFEATLETLITQFLTK